MPQNTLLILRGARRDDAMELYDLDIKCFENPWTADEWKSLCQFNTQSVFVVTFFGSIIGFIVCRPDNGEVEILKLGVKATHRKQGVSRKLLSAALVYAKDVLATALSIVVPESRIYPDLPDYIVEWLQKLEFKGTSPFIPKHFNSHGESENGVRFLRTHL